MSRPTKAADSFARGAGILALAGLVSRILGAVYRIPLARFLGAEGIGLFQLAYPIYSMVLAIATAGFPVAISKMVAEREARGARNSSLQVIKVSLCALGFFGIVGFGLLAAFSGPIADGFYHEPRAAASLIVMSPAIALLAIAAGLRGFFQGLRTMGPSGLSQVTEQITRVGVMVAAAILLRNKPLEQSVAAVSAGAAVGASVGLAVLLVSFAGAIARDYPSYMPSRKDTPLRILRELASLGVPIATGAIIVPLSGILDSLVVPARLLASGFSQREAVSLYGQLTGMALVLAYFPTVVTSAIAANLVPAISAARARRDRTGVLRKTDVALRMAVLISGPAAVGLYTLGPVITGVLFDCPEAGNLLRILAAGTLFLGIQQTCFGVLQGLGRVFLPVKNLVIGLGVKLVLSIALTNSELGASGAAVATAVGFGVSAILTVIDVALSTGISVSFASSIVKPAIAMLVMAWVAARTCDSVSMSSGSAAVGLMAGIAVGAVTYVCILVGVRGVTSDDLELITKHSRRQR